MFRIDNASRVSKNTRAHREFQDAVREMAGASIAAEVVCRSQLSGSVMALAAAWRLAKNCQIPVFQKTPLGIWMSGRIAVVKVQVREPIDVFSERVP